MLDVRYWILDKKVAPYFLSNGAGEGAGRDIEFNLLDLLISHL